MLDIHNLFNTDTIISEDKKIFVTDYVLCYWFLKVKKNIF